MQGRGEISEGASRRAPPSLGQFTAYVDSPSVTPVNVVILLPPMIVLHAFQPYLYSVILDRFSQVVPTPQARICEAALCYYMLSRSLLVKGCVVFLCVNRPHWTRFSVEGHTAYSPFFCCHKQYALSILTWASLHETFLGQWFSNHLRVTRRA